MNDNEGIYYLIKMKMWFIWIAMTMGAVMLSIFLTMDDARINAYDRDLGAFELSLMIIPFGICMAYRFLLLPKIKNLLVFSALYVIGVFIAQHILLYGMFSIKEYKMVFDILCGIAMLAYLPCWVKPQPKVDAATTMQKNG